MLSAFGLFLESRNDSFDQFGTVFFPQKGFLQSLHINIDGSSLNVTIAFAIDISPYSSSVLHLIACSLSIMKAIEYDDELVSKLGDCPV